MRFGIVCESNDETRESAPQEISYVYLLVSA